jgi:hypothetical protein
MISPGAGGKRRDLVIILVFALAAAAAVVAVDPRGNFPLNDDWAYSGPSRRLAEEGQLRLSDWTIPTALPQILLGAVLIKAGGFRHEFLRGLAYFLGWLTAVLLFLILRGRGAPRSWAALAAALLFFNPIFFVLSLTFHTDVPFLCLVLCAAYFYHRADSAGSARAEIAAAFFAAAAGLTRQPGFLLPLGPSIWYLVRHRLTWRRAARLWAIPIAAAVLWQVWFVRVHGPTWAHVYYLTTASWNQGQTPVGWLKALLSRSVASLLYAALFAAGVLLSGGVALRGRRSRAVIPALLWAGPIGYVLIRGAFPYLENTWTAKGLGVLTLGGGAGWKPAVAWSSPLAWFLFTFGGALALGSGLNLAFGVGWHEGRTFFSLLIAPVALAPLLADKYYDRYALPWLLVFLFHGAFLERGSSRPRLGWGLLVVWILVSLTGARDYFAWNRAKWTLGMKAREFGMAPGEVDNGFDWNAVWNYERNMAELKRNYPLDQIDQWDWNSIRPPRAIVFQQGAQPAGSRILATETYRSPLAPRGATLVLVEDGRRVAPHPAEP